MSRTICQLVDYGGQTGGSFVPALQSLAAACSARSDRFAVVASEVAGSTWPAELHASGATVFSVRDDRQAFDVLHELQPDIVHSHFFRFDTTAVHAARHARVFWHVHSHRADVSSIAHLRAFMKYRYLGRKVEALVAVSEATARECIKYSAPPNWVRVIPNGIDTARFRPPTAAERAQARQAFGIRENDRVILFFERLPYKGGAILREALAELTGVRLLVAGGTAAARARFGGAPEVISVGRTAEARRLYWAADVLAFASTNEAFGFVLAEALACGLPVAASNIPVVQEICADVAGVSRFPAGDAPALAEALVRALDGPPSAGRGRILQHFSLERWTAEMLRLYDS